MFSLFTKKLIPNIHKVINEIVLTKKRLLMIKVHKIFGICFTFFMNTVESRFKKARFKKESRFKKDCWYNRFFIT